MLVCLSLACPDIFVRGLKLPPSRRLTLSQANLNPFDGCCCLVWPIVFKKLALRPIEFYSTVIWHFQPQIPPGVEISVEIRILFAKSNNNN